MWIFLIFIIVGLLLSLIGVGAKVQAKKKAEDDKLRIERREAYRKAQREKEAEWKLIMDEKIREFGNLTKELDLRGKREDNIFVFEETQTIFLMGKKYTFKDILSCSIEKVLVKKGTTTHVTTPDSGQMAREQILWGMGKSYNVKSTTTVKTTPDVYKYLVYIGMKNISEPQLTISVSSVSLAHEVNNLMNVIIDSVKGVK